MDFVIGLWETTDCSGSNGGSCTDSAIPESYENTEVTVTRAMESCSLALLFVTTVCLLMYVSLKKARTRCMAMTMLIIGFLAVVCNIVGMVAWLINIPADHYASWSFGLTVCDAMLAIIATILLIPDIRKYDYKNALEVDEEANKVSMEEKEQHQSTTKLYEYNDLDRIFVPQTPMTPPTFQGLECDRRTDRTRSPSSKPVVRSPARLPISRSPISMPVARSPSSRLVARSPSGKPVAGSPRIKPIRERRIVNIPGGLSVYVLDDMRTVSPKSSVK